MTATFTSPDDFPQWEEDLISGARSRDLWDYMNPENRSPWPTRPRAPVISQYPLIANAEPLTATFADLTPAGRTYFLTAEDRYARALRQYEAYRTKATELTEWMRKSWYDNLRELGSTTRQVLKFKYFNEYKQFIAKAIGYRVTDLARWTEEWLNKNELYGVPIQTGTVATALRQEAAALSASRMPKERPYNSAFAIGDPDGVELPDSPEESAHEEPDDDDKGEDYTNEDDDDLYEAIPPRSSTKRPRADTDTDEECPICYGKHPATSCWYAFRRLCPEGWEPDPTYERIATSRLGNDEVAKRAWKRARRQLGL
ncbi:hypothetical protein CHU98_g2148 [Xylaria longipes]|nr:hypothetical protein CHU98_g2148 [Xylaria longipes]